MCSRDSKFSHFYFVLLWLMWLFLLGVNYRVLSLRQKYKADFSALPLSMAHVCVSTTARQAAEKGYDVVVAEDAVGDRDIPGVKAEDLVRTSLAELADAFGTVVKSADIN